MSLLSSNIYTHTPLHIRVANEYCTRKNSDQNNIMVIIGLIKKKKIK